MLIAQLGQATDERSGDWYYRTHAPNRALAEAAGVWAVEAAHIHRARQLLLQDADVLVINMVPDVDLRPVINWRRRHGRATVFEMNDEIANLHEETPHYNYYGHDPYEITKLKALLNLCDAVQFSTREVQRRYGRYARNSAVFLNQMAPRKHPRAARPPGDPIVIGWGGSYGHIEDLRRIEPALTAFVKSRTDVVLAIMADPRLYDVFKALPASKRRHVPIGSVDAYYQFLCGVDVGFAPLADTHLNRCRSDVKFLEMALHGVAPVVQALPDRNGDLGPYRDTVRDGDTGLFFGDADGLVAALRRLCDDTDLRRGLAARAQAYVERERTEAAAGAQRLALYQSLLPAGDPEARSARAQLVFERLEIYESLPGTGPRHRCLVFGDYEKLVWSGLVLGAQGQRGKAVATLAEAARLEPGAHQPHLFAAMFAGKGERAGHLEQALAREPRSLASWIDLGDERDDRGDSEGAFRAYTSAAEVDPGYDQAYAKTSVLLEKLGRAGEAREFGAVAAQIQRPFLDPAGSGAQLRHAGPAR